MMFNKSIIPLLIIFLIVAAIILVFRKTLQEYGFDWQLLSGSNLFIFLVTVLSMHLLNKGLNASNTHAFLRNAYSGILLKLFACAGAAFIYILVSGKNLNKSVLFVSMGLYLVYTFAEMAAIVNQSKQKKHVEN